MLGFSQQSFASGENLLSTLVGAAGGAAIGSNVGKGKGKIVSIAVGTLVGAAVGNSIGTSLENGNAYANNVTYTNVRYDYPPRYGHKNYYNDGSGHRYHNNGYGNRYRYHNPSYYSSYSSQTWVAPLRYTSQVPVVYNQAPVIYDQVPVAYNNLNTYDNNYCREYTSNVNVGGRNQRAYGKACLMADGSWQVVN